MCIHQAEQTKKIRFVYTCSCEIRINLDENIWRHPCHDPDKKKYVYTKPPVVRPFFILEIVPVHLYKNIDKTPFVGRKSVHKFYVSNKKKRATPYLYINYYYVTAGVTCFTCICMCTNTI